MAKYVLNSLLPASIPVRARGHHSPQGPTHSRPILKTPSQTSFRSKKFAVWICLRIKLEEPNWLTGCPRSSFERVPCDQEWLP